MREAEQSEWWQTSAGGYSSARGENWGSAGMWSLGFGMPHSRRRNRTSLFSSSIANLVSRTARQPWAVSALIYTKQCRLIISLKPPGQKLGKSQCCKTARDRNRPSQPSTTSSDRVSQDNCESLAQPGDDDDQEPVVCQTIT